MPTLNDHSVIGLYENHYDAEIAVRALQSAALGLRRLSIIGKAFQREEHAVGMYVVGERIEFWGGRRAFWRTMWSMLSGCSFFVLPSLGPVVVMGPLVTALVMALEAGATGALGAALINAGIPTERALHFEQQVKAGRFLLMGHGPAEDVERVRGVLARSGGAQLAAHAPGALG
jgi:hypothetical protein